MGKPIGIADMRAAFKRDTNPEHRCGDCDKTRMTTTGMCELTETCIPAAEWSWLCGQTPKVWDPRWRACGVFVEKKSAVCPDCGGSGYVPDGRGSGEFCGCNGELPR